MAVLVRERGDDSAAGFDILSPYDVGDTPVAALDENVWQNGSDEGQRRGFIEHGYVAHALQFRQKQTAFELIQDRPLRSL
jgi:hypothetical protein